MKYLNVLFIALISLTILSCNSDDNNPTNSSETNTNAKKLIKVLEEGSYGIYEREFIYNSDNKVIEIESSFTEFGQNVSDIHNTVFTYENNSIISAVNFEDGTLYKTTNFNYFNNKLIEKIIYDSNNVEEEKLEFNYNPNDEMDSFDFYYETNFQQTQNYTYNSNENITIAQDIDYSQIQYDNNPTPSNGFSNSEKIIFAAENLIMSLSKNNELNRTTTYNYLQANETIRHFETSITYDTDNYPINKVVVQTDNNGNEINTRTTTFEYE